MQPVSVLGAPSDRYTLLEGLLERLGDRGRVGTIGTVDRSTIERPEGAAVSYEITDPGWGVRGDARTLSDALDRLATDCEYAVLDGLSHPRVPAIVLGDEPETADFAETIATANDPTDLDHDELLAAIDAGPGHVTLESLVDEIEHVPESERAGAIATFTGRVRARDGPEDSVTKALEFEKYEGVAEERLATVRADLEAREGVEAVRTHHRTGRLAAGEDIVFVVVLAGHRKAAFRAVSDGIDRLKEEVPIFKKEITTEGSFWRHERE